MLKVGTYNAIITANEYYSPENSDFASSHKTFKRMMPTFAWEVLEVYSGPPLVAFKWRHWGTMVKDYVGFNEYAIYNHICRLGTDVVIAKEKRSLRRPMGDKLTSKELPLPR